MNINFNDYFWGDSTLDKIEIEYDKITITVYNDAMKKTVCLECAECIGITQLVTWDEVIIEDVFLEEIPNQQHPLIEKVKSIYGGAKSEFIKRIEGTFFELKILLINNESFSVICREVRINET